MRSLKLNKCILTPFVDTLCCGRAVDLSEFDVENAVASSYVTKNEQRKMEDMQPTPLEIVVEELQETNKKIFVMFTFPKFTSNSTEIRDNVPTPNIPITPTGTVFDILMVQHTHYPTLKPDPKTGDVHQRYGVVSYIHDQKFGIKGTVLEDFQKLVGKFCALLWEIDLHYYELKARGCSFPNNIEKSFLGFDNPQSHGHRANQLCSSSLTLKVNGLRIFEYRAFMRINLMKKFKNIIIGICNSIEKNADYLEKQVNLVKEHHEITTFPECSTEDFTIKKGQNFC